MSFIRDMAIQLGLATQDMRLQKGKELWLQLDEKLPKAVGALVNDTPRVERFSLLVAKLPKAYRKCIIMWLADELAKSERAKMSDYEEKAERKYRQIIRQHYSALVN